MKWIESSPNPKRNVLKHVSETIRTCHSLVGMTCVILLIVLAIRFGMVFADDLPPDGIRHTLASLRKANDEARATSEYKEAIALAKQEIQSGHYRLKHRCRFEPYDTYFRDALKRFDVDLVYSTKGTNRVIGIVIMEDGNKLVRDALAQKYGIDVLQVAENEAVARSQKDH